MKGGESGAPLNILVVATWGFPGGWRPAKYRPPRPPGIVGKWGKLSEWGFTGGRIASHSATLALACALRREGHNVKVVIFGLDTLAAATRPNCSPGDSLCEEAARELEEGFKCPEPQGMSYDVILGRARGILDLYVGKFRGELGDCLDGVEVEVYVLPGTGSFRCNLGGLGASYAFEGSPLNAYALMRLELARILRESLDSGSPFNALMLDVSHGINYLPVLAREAALRAVEAYSALAGETVGFAVVNSDPALAPNMDLDIHLVEARAVGYRPAQLLALRASDALKEPYVSMTESERMPPEADRLSKALKSARSEWEGVLKALTVAFEHGLILYLAHKLLAKGPPGSGQVRCLEEALRSAAGSRMVSVEDGAVRVRQPYAIQPQALDLIDALLLVQGMHSRVSGLEWRSVEGSVLFNIDDLKALAGYVGVSRVAGIILSNEVYNVKLAVDAASKLAGADLSGPVVYDALIKFASTSLAEIERKVKEGEKKGRERRTVIQKILDRLNGEARRADCAPDERNFLAHAGMERTVTLVSQCGGRVYVGYRGECTGRVDALVSATAGSWEA